MNIRALWISFPVLSTLLTSLLITSLSVRGEEYRDNYGDRLGQVHLTVSCQPEASALFQRGLALLHHMTYASSRAAFSAAAAADPDCAMARWGQAMTLIHPLWSDPPDAGEFEQAKRWLTEARNRGPLSEREEHYIAALESYFAPGRGSSEKDNLKGFAAGWERVYQRYPDDPEAAGFHALGLLAISPASDKNYSGQQKASAIAEKILTGYPDHPGAHHYLIHARDYPALAAGALKVARSYGTIAPEIPHALHMPTHIFTRLGLWPDSIDMNTRSAAAALKHPVAGRISLHYLHAIDYLAYAHLQRGENRLALAAQDKLRALTTPVQPHIASAYTFAAVPARYTLEQRLWREAARLPARAPESLDWDRFPAMEAITHFARALGAAHNGDFKASEQSLEKLKLLQRQTVQHSAYWAGQVEIQRLSAQAWLQYRRGEHSGALATMLEAAELESATEKHPVTPGEVLPAQELLADMYLSDGQYPLALTAYQKALERSPNRFNSLFGLARSAELMEDDQRARAAYRRFLAVTADSAEREEVLHARNYLQ